MCVAKKVLLTLVLVMFAVCFVGCSTNPSEYYQEKAEDNIDTVNKEIADVKNENDAESIIDNAYDSAEENADKSYNSINDAASSSYYAALEEFRANMNADGTKQPWSKTLLLGFYGFYVKLRLWTPVIIFAFMFLGLIIFLCARGNKGTRKFALFGMMIGVPLFLVILIYGIGYLNGMFLY